jgi:ribosome recycling factor
MRFDIKDFKTRGDEVVKWLEKEFASVRTGRATPMLLDLVTVESYGMKVPLQQVGNVSVEDAKTLRISIWDHSVVKEVERAIIAADLGVSVNVDASGIRVIFPDLTSERREQLLKLGKAKLEEARVSLRGARDESIKHIEADLKAGEMTEDGKFTGKAELQKSIDHFNNILEEMFVRKQTEINQ